MKPICSKKSGAGHEKSGGRRRQPQTSGSRLPSSFGETHQQWLQSFSWWVSFGCNKSWNLHRHISFFYPEKNVKNVKKAMRLLSCHRVVFLLRLAEVMTRFAFLAWRVAERCPWGLPRWHRCQPNVHRLPAARLEELQEREKKRCHDRWYLRGMRY